MVPTNKSGAIMFPSFSVFSIIILGLIISFVVTVVRVADQYKRAVVLRFGSFVGVRGPGLYFLLPWGIERAISVDIRTTTWSLPQQEAITKDNVPVKITAVLWNRIVDPAKSVLDVENVEAAIRQLAATTMRSVVGLHELDEVLSGGGQIAEIIAQKIEQIAPTWGVEVSKVEIANVEIPENMQRAIAQKAEATREQAARLIKAEAEYKAAIKLAEAARLIAQTPEALELRRMQMLTEIGAEQNTMTVVMMPSEFVQAAGAFAKSIQPKE
jgi:regulator of protease activity HflC (stomatin/prohibitin superfamily)